MSYKSEWNSNSFDSGILKREADDHISESVEIQELGEKFLNDKKKLEEQIDKIETSMLSADDIKKMLQKLLEAIEILKKRYDREVIMAQQNLYKKIEEDMKKMNTAELESEEQAESLKSISLESSFEDADEKVNINEAADEAEDMQKRFEEMQIDTKVKLQKQMEQSDIQEDEMKTLRLKK